MFCIAVLVAELVISVWDIRTLRTGHYIRPEGESEFLVVINRFNQDSDILCLLKKVGFYFSYVCRKTCLVNFYFDLTCSFYFTLLASAKSGRGMHLMSQFLIISPLYLGKVTYICMDMTMQVSNDTNIFNSYLSMYIFVYIRKQFR